MILRRFTPANSIPEGTEFHLIHNSEDDSRHVTDKTGKKLGIEFDSNMGVKQDGRGIGNLMNQGGNWWFNVTGGAPMDLKVPVKHYHWKQIEDAEIEIAKILISLMG